MTIDYFNDPRIKLERAHLYEQLVDGTITARNYLDSLHILIEEFENKEQKEPMNDNKLNVKITNQDNGYGNSRTYRYNENNSCVLSLNQIPYPNCCGIAILKDFSVAREIPRDVFISAISDIVEDLKKTDRFSKVLIYTTNISTESTPLLYYPKITILDSFRNRRSGNTLVGFEINLLEEENVDDDEDADINMFNEPVIVGRRNLYDYGNPRSNSFASSRTLNIDLGNAVSPDIATDVFL